MSIFYLTQHTIKNIFSSFNQYKRYINEIFYIFVILSLSNSVSILHLEHIPRVKSPRVLENYRSFLVITILKC